MADFRRVAPVKAMNPDFSPASTPTPSDATHPRHTVHYTATHEGYVTPVAVVWTLAAQAEAHAAMLRTMPHISGVAVTHSMCGKSV